MEAVLYEPISPELVLVSPPDLASRARAVLPDTPVPRWLPLALPQSEPASRLQTALEATGLTLVCALATLGPFALVIAERT